MTVPLGPVIAIEYCHASHAVQLPMQRQYNAPKGCPKEVKVTSERFTFALTVS